VTDLKVSLNEFNQAMLKVSSAFGNIRRIIEVDTDKTNIYDFIERKKTNQPFYKHKNKKSWE